MNARLALSALKEKLPILLQKYDDYGITEIELSDTEYNPKVWVGWGGRFKRGVINSWNNSIQDENNLHNFESYLKTGAAWGEVMIVCNALWKKALKHDKK